jgi:hypothetical protein
MAAVGTVTLTVQADHTPSRSPDDIWTVLQYNSNVARCQPLQWDIVSNAVRCQLVPNIIGPSTMRCQLSRSGDGTTDLPANVHKQNENLRDKRHNNKVGRSHHPGCRSNSRS